MRTLKLTVAYDGSRYAGWQIQQMRSGKLKVGSGGSQKPTIQETLEQVVAQILQEKVRVVGSGRTDAGVHALAQVAHVRIKSRLPTERLLHGLNALLPPDIAVTQLKESKNGFHARFDAVRKRYRYRLFTGAVVPPFIRPYVHHVRVPLNLALMRREAAALKGRHNFRAFARAGGPPGGAIRTMTDVRLLRVSHELQFEIEGTGFLHTMVRSIVGTLIYIGRGRLPSGTIRRLLRTQDRTGAGTTAPANGLVLVDVHYKETGS
mgnify:CR=1 FL=1